MPSIADDPGLLYVLATLIPLLAFVAMLVVGGIKNLARTYKESGWGSSLYWFLGGDRPGKTGAYVATGSIALACALSFVGLARFLSEFPVSAHHDEAAAHSAEGHGNADGHAKAGEHVQHDHKSKPHEKKQAWAGRLTWAAITGAKDDDSPSIKLELGYYIDHFGAIMFAMVAFVATLIHIFAIGYMADETQETVEDHQVHGSDGGHLRRRGRYNRFFMFFSLFCFSMLNLVMADNFFQVFVSWELVGACSFWLIGFYYERQSASNAANKAFITNRVGDAGFIIGLMILWTYVGSFNFQEVFARIRAPQTDAHGEKLPGTITPGGFVRVGPAPDVPDNVVPAPGGPAVLLMPGHLDADTLAKPIKPDPNRPGYDFATMPYWLLVVAGLGIFLGCVGKSAQFPLQVWLPDAMEGPTPVSALVHSATMVAAGVYFVGRVFPLFTEEARLIIAYTGGITLFVAATIAVVAFDIKKVLAYSTISQLGFMMLALGIGGWVAGLMHLLTHAFFKALLFLCSGSVIYGCHHEQDMRKMGGLYPKMRTTALTMLIGVLAIAGTPLFSGWYSKDAIIAESLGYVIAQPRHFLLLLLPVVTAGITCFYMFRMWFMTFTGRPQDDHVFHHAHESPRVMTVPLMVLAAFSVFVAWGWPLWDPHASALGHTLEMSQPASVHADFGNLHELAHDRVPAFHELAGFIALGAAVLGAVFAYLMYYRRAMNPADAVEQFPRVYRLLENKWYFDEFYSAMVVRPALVVGGWFRNFDLMAIDGFIDGLARATIRAARLDGRFDNSVIDGAVNLVGNTTYAVGGWFRRAQTGFIRSYVLFLALAAIILFVPLTYFVKLVTGK
jgi:NADH-quinone oxidoreductase subunit L